MQLLGWIQKAEKDTHPFNQWKSVSMWLMTVSELMLPIETKLKKNKFVGILTYLFIYLFVYCKRQSD